MLEMFVERAAECQWLAQHAISGHDRELFERMARAWSGNEEDDRPPASADVN